MTGAVLGGAVTLGATYIASKEASSHRKLDKEAMKMLKGIEIVKEQQQSVVPQASLETKAEQETKHNLISTKPTPSSGGPGSIAVDIPSTTPTTTTAALAGVMTITVTPPPIDSKNEANSAAPSSPISEPGVSKSSDSPEPTASITTTPPSSRSFSPSNGGGGGDS